MKPIKILPLRATLPNDLVVAGYRSSSFKNHVADCGSIRRKATVEKKNWRWRKNEKLSQKGDWRQMRHRVNSSNGL